MKIAVVGANGFIGSRLVEQLHLGGVHQVVPVVRKPFSLALPARFDLEWRLGDALDLGSLTKALTGCDAVVHAAIGDPRQIEQMPAIFCRAAHEAKVPRVIYLSSASVHGQAIATPVDESSPLHTRHNLDYNNAKVRAERSFLRDVKKYQLAGYALRPGVVFGPRSRWIADLADDLLSGRAWLFAGGTGICNSIYVDNLNAAIFQALTAQSGAGEAYLVGDAETVTWADFYFAVADALSVPRARLHALERLPSFTKNFRQKVDDTVAQPWVQALLPAIPYSWKRGTKNLLAAWNPPPAPDAWSLPRPAGPRVTEELALLQQCQVKFGHQKAAKVLGYQPPVPFADGMRRSLGWWRFAAGQPENVT